MTIDRPRGLGIGDGTAVSRIADVDPRPVIQGGAVAVTEPVAEPTTVSVPFNLSRPSAKRIEVVVTTRPGTADGADYVSSRVRRVITPGAGVLLVDVTVLADELEEAEELFTLEVVEARRVRVGRAATVTIQPPQPAPEPEPKRSQPGPRTRSAPAT